MIQIKNSHEKITDTVNKMLIDTKYSLPYYGNFNLIIAFHENQNMPTAGVNMTVTGMNFYYNPKFIDRLSQKEVNFLVIHEDFHLLWDHPRRTISGQYEHSLANIVQDMIINHIIWQDISHNFVEIPKNEEGKNMALFVPKEYTGKLIFEVLYTWVRDKRDEHRKKKEQEQKCKPDCKSCSGTGKQQPQQKGQQEQGQGDKQESQDGGKGQQDGQDGKDPQEGDGSGQGQPQDQQGNGNPQDGQGDGSGEEQDCPDCNGSGKEPGQGKGQGKGSGSYGPYGQDPSNSGGSIDTYSLDEIFDNMDENNGEYLDSHITDEIPEEMREGIIKDTIERLSARGFVAGNIEETLGKLRKKKKDHLRYIKRCISNQIFGTKKEKTISRPHRRGIMGMKGARKIKNRINIILDVSGSMNGLIERVLDYVFKNDVEVTLIEADTQVNFTKHLKSTKGLDKVPIKGMGGTVLQPAVDYVEENLNKYATLILTDGYCDSLDLSALNHHVLIVSAGVEVPITRSNGKTKQIHVDERVE